MTVFLVVTMIVVFDSPEKFLHPDNTTQSATTKTIPIAVAYHTSSSHYKEDGTLDYIFNAKKLEHFQELTFTGFGQEASSILSYTLIKNPSLKLLMDTSPWTVQSEHGRLSEQGQRLMLWDKVLISQISEDRQTATLETNNLVILPQERLIETQEPVKITTPSGEITAVGMTADLDKKKIKLLSKVRGIHEPI